MKPWSILQGTAIRTFKDELARVLIYAGGWSVVVAVTLIFLFLLSVITPLFTGVSIQSGKLIQFNSHSARFLYAVSDEYQETLSEVYQNARIHHASIHKNTVDIQNHLPNDTITSFSRIQHSPTQYVWGTESGKILFTENHFERTYPNGKRLVIPGVRPAFEEAEPINAHDAPINKIAARLNDELLWVATVSHNELYLHRFNLVEALDGSTLFEIEETITPQQPNQKISSVHISNDGRWLLAVTSQAIIQYNLSDIDQDPITLPYSAPITASAWLLGESTLLVGDQAGHIAKIFLIDGQWRIVERQPVSSKPIVHIVSEQLRRVFAAFDAAQNMYLYYAPSFAELKSYALPLQPQNAFFTPRSDAILIYGDTQKITLQLDNPHPEVTWKSLWGLVHYEGHTEPKHIWQSSAATQDFEPKISLTPLTFGTLKAAFYAMLMAIPIALFGAIYTAFFMSPSMRRIVKPTIETMEALPTVILGFLAGLWLSPFVEKNLAGVFALLIMLPIGVLLFGWFWQKAPQAWQDNIGDGWRAALIVPIIIVTAWFSFVAAPIIESIFFGGNLRNFISLELGITYDQRNAMVVGFAMGFAVIPTIFSIAEDALFSVPKHLVNGSLALGASSWQTLTGVVLPTASPGIFSAMMIGFGRAVGETMIVLMATGNTPVMNFNIFEGMRTLAANTAVEMPESEVGSSHYRILFLAALVLFLFTFTFNTGAEVIRQRLRKKYGSL